MLNLLLCVCESITVRGPDIQHRAASVVYPSFSSGSMAQVLVLQLYFGGTLRRINYLGAEMLQRQNLESATCVPYLPKCNCRTNSE
jgi:hypothetical protein